MACRGLPPRRGLPIVISVKAVAYLEQFVKALYVCQCERNGALALVGHRAFASEAENMSMTLLLLIYVLLGPPCHVYTTVAASDAWIAATQQLPLKQQVAAVRQRLTCDARVRGPVPAAAVCVSCLTAEGQRAFRAAQEKQRQAEAADPRPQGIVLFYMLDGRVLVPTDTAQWRSVVTRRRVQKINWLTSEKAVAVAGARAQGGMVVITTKQQR
jgi:hypothetical protein